MTPEKLREKGNRWRELGQYDLANIYNQHAAALEEIERLNGELAELKELLIEKTKVERGYRDAFVKAERRAERLKVHAEAMAARIEWYAEEGWVNGDIPEARAYRAEFKDGEK